MGVKYIIYNWKHTVVLKIKNNIFFFRPFFNTKLASFSGELNKLALLFVSIFNFLIFSMKI